MASSLSEKDAVLRERRAYVAGLEDACWRDSATKAAGLHAANAEAARQYPLPKVERARVAADIHSDLIQWSTRIWHDDKRIVVWRYASDPTGKWQDSPRGWVITPQRIAIWDDLLDRPTEFVVPDEGSESDQEGSR